MNQAHEKCLVHLVLGGARSGKTAFGMRLAEEAAREKWMIATAEPFDDEMKARIEQHRQERDHSWRIVEEPLDLLDALQCYAAHDRVLLVDCLPFG
jgi:adenosylcobinamide kinase / adenosylcobinamide-phosphate guanylyltransferase